MTEWSSPRANLHVITDNNFQGLDDDQLEKLYTWLDTIPLSRPKRNVTRDFSDGVLFAEIIKYFLPRLVDVHNYTSASCANMKQSNWCHLNRKVMHRIGLEISSNVVHSIIACKLGVVEYVLSVLRDNLNLEMSRRRTASQLADWETEQMANRRNPNNKKGDSVDNNNATVSYVPSALEGLPASPRGHIAKYSSMQKVRRLNHLNLTESVPKSILDERLRELKVKEDGVQSLLTKIEKLEHTLRLKDRRIEELSSRVDCLEHEQLSQLPKPAVKRAVVRVVNGHRNKQFNKLHLQRFYPQQVGPFVQVPNRIVRIMPNCGRR